MTEPTQTASPTAEPMSPERFSDLATAIASGLRSTKWWRVAN